MTPTAAQILDYCKAVCVRKDYIRCQVSRVSLRDPEAGYYITRLGWGVTVDANSPRHKIEQAATLLGIDCTPAPVVLEWVEDELKYESVAHHAYYNGLIECYISASKDGKAKFAWISVNRSRVANMTEKYQHVKTAHEARAWCEAEIQKIITPTPKP